MKFVVRLGFIFLISWIFYLIPNKFLHLDFFKIKEIKIEGNSKILSRELTELTNSIYNSNIWELDLKKIEEYLEKDIRIKDIVLKTPSLGKLNIEIEERELAYYAQIDGTVYLIDEEGVIFGYLKEKPEKDTYFIVAKNEDELRELLKISQKIDSYILKSLISQICLKSKDCIELILTDGTIIKTNFEVEKEKYKIVETLYFDLIKTKKLEYIDLRFNDFIVKSLGDKSNDK